MKQRALRRHPHVVVDPVGRVEWSAWYRAPVTFLTSACQIGFADRSYWWTDSADRVTP